VAQIQTVHQSFLHELSDCYDAERQFAQAMQGMLGMAQHPQVKQGLQQHIEETRQQIENLDRVFKSLGGQPEQVPCKGAAGIIAELRATAREVAEPQLLDGLILGGSAKGEHYEIATYRCLVEKPALMGHEEAHGLLQENLRMEERFAQQCEQLDKQLGQQLVQQHPQLVGHAVGR
jgi:ferritin-like metal-binding protein YciE